MTVTVFRLAARKRDGHLYGYGDTFPTKGQALETAPALNRDRESEFLPPVTHIIELLPQGDARSERDRIVSVTKL